MPDRSTSSGPLPTLTGMSTPHLTLASTATPEGGVVSPQQLASASLTAHYQVTG